MANPANINAPSGFTRVKHSAGGTMRPSQSAIYAIAGGLASNIFRGSLVKPTGLGNNIDVVAAGANPSIGPFHGVNFVDAGGNTQFLPKWISGQTVQAGSVPQASRYHYPALLFDAPGSATPGPVAAQLRDE